MRLMKSRRPLREQSAASTEIAQNVERIAQMAEEKQRGGLQQYGNRRAACVHLAETPEHRGFALQDLSLRRRPGRASEKTRQGGFGYSIAKY
jgi:hypothetical protein